MKFSVAAITTLALATAALAAPAPGWTWRKITTRTHSSIYKRGDSVLWYEFKNSNTSSPVTSLSIAWDSEAEEPLDVQLNYD